MAFGDAGLAHEHWKSFYTPDEVAEIVAATSSTMIVSGNYPIHVRLYVRAPDAPTIIMSHPMLPYGLLLARLQLPFYRAGFNVVQWDLPGWGQSGGARANCPIPDFLRAWNDAIRFTRSRFQGLLYAMGLAEDSVTCYYVGANHPDLQALSLHTLHEYGDPDGVHWQGPPWLLRAKALGVGVATRIRPDLALQAEDALPWRAIFSGPNDGPLLRAFAGDPLRVRRFHFKLVGSMMGKIAPPVPLEECRTPVQVIASEKSSLWPYAMNVRYFNRLGGPKELVTLENMDQWVYTREFHEMYAAHVIRWFKSQIWNGSAMTDTNTDRPAQDYWKQYYTPAEVDEVLANTQTTMIVSGGLPIHVRLWVQPKAAPTVVIGSSILSYGLHLVRVQAPFFRAGFNVVQFDFPGLGQSGGPRGGCTVRDFLRCWRDAMAFAHLQFGDPMYVMGVGEDGVTGYYVGANKPHVRALSVHNLFEYGEPDAVQGQGPYWMVRAKAAALSLAALVRPTTEMPGSQAVPWEWIFAGPGDDEGIRLLHGDPLSLQTIQFRMVSSILEKLPAPVPFEQCRTPVQVIASDRNLVCPYDLVTRNYQRLGGPKELITLEGKPQWELNREFHEMYCAHVIRWFEANGASQR